MDILILDNSKIYTHILESNLDPESNDIHYFKLPDIALEAAQTKSFEYICVSYYLDKMDGIEFARQVRQLESYAHVPIILFASRKESSIFEKALNNGITDIFYKEDDVQELIAHIIRFSQRKNKINAEVLLIEDSLSQQQLIRYRLEKIGLTVTSHENATDAFHSFLEKDYDLVITDILLEGHVSGVKLVNMIRRLDNDKGDVPILAMTAFDNLSRRIDLFCRGISDYVQKPIVEEEFLSRVNNLINNQRLLKLLREQRKAIEQATEDELSVMACAFESSDAILISDAFGHIIRSNHSYSDICGYTSDEVIGKNIWKYCFYNDDQNQAQENLQTIRKHLQETGLPWEGKARNIRKNGELFDAEIKISITRNFEQEIRHYVVVFSDTSSKNAAEKQLLERQFRDELTGLGNRKFLMTELERIFIEAMSEKNFGALLFINLLRFKSINDSYGLPVGDKLLDQVSRRLENQVENKGLVARIGGLKFVILLPGLSQSKEQLSAKAEEFACRINEAIQKPYLIDGYSIHLSNHIGVSFFPSGQNSIHDIIKQAELANYSASLDKTSIFFFNESMQEGVHKTAYIEQNIQNALKNNELSLIFQPQYNRFSQIIGCEALVRWQHEGEMIPPDLFIPAAEENMLIEPIGEWVINEAVSTVERWRALNLINDSFKIAINVSPVQFLQDGFIKSMNHLIERFPKAVESVQLELTESIFIEKIDTVIAKMKQLKIQDIEFAIDDFGTGYSSLSYLSRLPISYLKIDKSFIRDINVDSNNETIVETIISMAHHMGMKVIAEGVETKRQFLFLQTKQCEYFQGYLFSKPLEQKKFEKLLQAHLSNEQVSELSNTKIV